MELATVTLIAQFALKFGVPAALALAELFAKKEATIEDVRKAFALAHTSYDQYEALVPGGPVPALPASGPRFATERLTSEI